MTDDRPSLFGRLRRNWLANADAEAAGSWREYFGGMLPIFVAVAVLAGVLALLGFGRFGLRLLVAYLVGVSASVVMRVVGLERGAGRSNPEDPPVS